MEFDPESLLNLYFKKKMMEDVGSGMVKSFLPDTEEENLTHQSMRTDIDYKRKMMGMPLDDDDYEHAVNDDYDFPQPATNLLGSFGKRVSDRLPSLRHFHPSGIPSMRGIGNGGRIGGTVSRVARFFG